MLTLDATIPCLRPPGWAVLERRLLEAMDRSVEPFLRKYTLADGTLIWRDTLGGRDGADDFYESFYNWPLLYLLGGGAHLLPLAHRQWDAVTRQLTKLGQVYREYERGYDQFHQGESYIYLYYLCLADPQNQGLLARARRFAGLYLDEDSAAPNYDPGHKIIRAPHNGSGGPRWGLSDGEPSYGWSAGMAPYGLPYEDVEGVRSYEDLKDPVLARRMGAVMQERMGKGDVAVNLCVTSLVTNAYLLTGDEKCRRWVLEYVDAWRERAERQGGLLPDNVGLSGQVGEYMGGKWYGGLYGWAWPHGFYNLQMAATVAASNAYLLTGDEGYLDLPRRQMDQIMGRGEMRDLSELSMSLRAHWVGQASALDGQKTLVVPYRYGDSGWFDWQPLSPIYPAALWSLSARQEDWERLERLRAGSGYDWRTVVQFRGKEDAGHEQPWLRYLAGDNPGYPEEMLSSAYGTVCRRLELIRQDRSDLTKVGIHHWQQLNPVTTEALVQLTLGAPQPIYNGGLLLCRLFYLDAVTRRPGLPPDVAALGERIQGGDTVVRLVNLDPQEAREVVIQGGAFGEHRIDAVTFDARTSEYPGDIESYAPPNQAAQSRRLEVGGTRFSVRLPAATEIRLKIACTRFANRPSYQA
jgi:hypothetical protein